MLIIIVVVVVVVLGCGAAAAYYVKKGGSIAAKDIERVADDDEEGQHNPWSTCRATAVAGNATGHGHVAGALELLAQDSKTAVPDLLGPLEPASPAFSGRQARCPPTATDEGDQPGAPLAPGQSCGAKGRCGQLMRRARRRRRRRPRREASARLRPAEGLAAGLAAGGASAAPGPAFSTVGEAVQLLAAARTVHAPPSTHRRGSLRVAPLQPPKEPDDQSPNQVTPSGAPCAARTVPAARRAGKHRSSHLGRPGSLQRASSLRASRRVNSDAVTSRRPRRRRGSSKSRASGRRPIRARDDDEGLSKGRAGRTVSAARAAPRPASREAPEFSPSADPGSLPRASLAPASARRVNSAPETPTRVSPRVAPLGAGQAAPETTKGLSKGRAGRRSLRREGQLRGPPRREAPEFSPSADPGSLLRASSLRRERSTRQLAARDADDKGLSKGRASGRRPSCARDDDKGLSKGRAGRTVTAAREQFPRPAAPGSAGVRGRPGAARAGRRDRS